MYAVLFKQLRCTENAIKMRVEVYKRAPSFPSIQFKFGCLLKIYIDCSFTKCFHRFLFFHTGKTRTCFLLRHIFRNKLFHVHPCIDFLWSGNTQFSVQSPLKMWGRKVSLFQKSVFR